MNKKIFSLELEGTQVLGFDTVLNPRSFAQAKMAECITQQGTIIYPDGTVESWQPGGVTEYIPSAFMPSANMPGAKTGRQAEGTMVIWGPDFPGEELAAVIGDEGRKDEALDAIRFWIKAARVMGSKLDDASFPGPSGAFIATTNVVTGKKASPKNRYPVGTVFFPPFRLLKRTLDAAGDEALLDAGTFFHPDLNGDEAISFSAGAMLYRVFCDFPPYKRDNNDELHQDIREGVFAPPSLAKAGLSEEMSTLIAGAMGPIPKKNEIRHRPTPDYIAGILGHPNSRKVSSWIESLSDEESTNIRTEYERYEKKTASAVKTRRFVSRNRTAVTIALIALIGLALTIRGVIQRQAALPTTKGLAPLEVAQMYYGAFDDLDHTVMEACVSGRAGRDDINMITNFFVITRVRQGYEMRETFMPAQQWIDAGRPPTNDTVFGITDLRLSVLSAGETNATIEANYTLWMPGSYSPEDEAEWNMEEALGDVILLPPDSVVIRDRLELAFEKDRWRITGIERTSRAL